MSEGATSNQMDFFSLAEMGANKSLLSFKPNQSTTNTSATKRVSTLTFDPSMISATPTRRKVPEETYEEEEEETSKTEMAAYEEEEEEDRFYVSEPEEEPEPEGEECTLCGQIFSSSMSLQMHMRVHYLKNEPVDTSELIHLPQKVKPKREPYVCSFCQGKFYSKFILRQHIRIHTGNVPFRCPICDRRFSHGRNLHRHIKKFHQDSGLDGAELAAKILQETNVSENKMVVYTGEGLKPYKCSVCNKAFRKLYRVKEHTRTHTGQKPFQCSFCNKTFSSSDILYRHIKNLHKDRGSSGSVSGSKNNKSPSPVKQRKLGQIVMENGTTIIQIEDVSNFENVDDGGIQTDEHQQQQVQVQNGETTTFLHQSSETGVISIDADSLLYQGTPTFYIDESGQLQPIVSAPAQHQQPEQHQVVQVQHELHTHAQQAQQVQVQEFHHTNPQVQVHHDIHTHHEEVQHEMHEVHEQVQQHEIHAHEHEQQGHHHEEEMHTEEYHDIEQDHVVEQLGGENVNENDEDSTTNAFQCSLCGEAFATTHLLNRHIDTHQLQLPTRCHICSKSFKAESYLKRHMLVHSGERPFQCPHCPKNFNRQYRLNNHLRTHTGERPYACSVCGKSFAVTDNMYRHIKKMHKGAGMEVAAHVVKRIQEDNRERKYYARMAAREQEMERQQYACS